jgi:sterol desaturase/sphingolipid hydroxylase (fatty acid hydroxylase superfamily)
MLSDLVSLLIATYGGFWSSYGNLAIVGAGVGFTLAACFVGLRQRVLSRSAVLNTLTTFAILMLNIALAPLVHVVAGLVRQFYQSLDIPHLGSDFWAGLPWIVVAIAALVAKDFSDYWVHRALHTPLGWPIHAIHHSDTHVNAFTTFRVHILEVVAIQIFYIFLLTWIGIPQDVIVLAYIFASLHNAYVHFEIDIDHGRFNWLLASPRYHRWHHADVPAAYGKNLANMMPIYDIMFGTHYKAGRCDAPMGAERDGIPGTDPARLMLLPFTLWARMAQGGLLRLRSRLRPSA